MRRWIAENYARHYMLRFATPIIYSREVLKILKDNNIKLAIVTNQTKKQATVSLKIIKFDKFSTVITADMVKRAKPYPDSLNLALKKLKLKNNEVIFIGDTKNDVKAGHAARIETYLLEHKYNQHIKTKKIKTLKKIVKMVI